MRTTEATRLSTGQLWQQMRSRLGFSEAVPATIVNYVKSDSKRQRAPAVVRALEARAMLRAADKKLSRGYDAADLDFLAHHEDEAMDKIRDEAYAMTAPRADAEDWTFLDPSTYHCSAWLADLQKEMPSASLVFLRKLWLFVDAQGDALHDELFDRLA